MSRRSLARSKQLGVAKYEFNGAARGRTIGAWLGLASMMTAIGPSSAVGWSKMAHAVGLLSECPIALVTIWMTLKETPRTPRIAQ
jgi:hypothetical protein